MAFLDRGGVRLYFELEGQGEPVLFIQGVGVAGSGWRPQVQGLATEFSTLIFDNRGLGRSAPCSGPIRLEEMAADAAALLEAVGWETAHVVGHSLGGLIAQQLALDAPSRVRSLSLVCTFAHGREAARLTPWVLWMTLRTRLGSRSSRRRAFLEMLYPAAALKGRNLPQLAEEVGALIGRDLADSPSILLKQVRAMARHDVSGRLGELGGIPTLVLSAECDPIAQPRYGRELASRIPGAAFELLAAASHGVTLQEPKLINDRLRRFFRGRNQVQ